MPNTFGKKWNTNDVNGEFSIQCFKFEYVIIVLRKWILPVTIKNYPLLYKWVETYIFIICSIHHNQYLNS